jgi:glyoxylase-like metal-dependent hydrolase (beta-lactamase superfamily II)
MRTKLILALAVLALVPRPGVAQDAKATLDAVAKAMGDLKTVQIVGNGTVYSFGQSSTPGKPWPRFTAKSFTRSIDYETPAMQDEIVRVQADAAERGGGGIPLPRDQKQVLSVSGTHAWAQIDQNPPGPQLHWIDDRLHQIWMTPHGIVKAALKHNATVQTDGGKKTITVNVPGSFKATAVVNDRNLVEKVDYSNTNPVLGDMQTETVYADYKDFGGVQFPTKITQNQAGAATLEIAVSEIKPNAPVSIQVPDNVRQTAVKVASDKIADGVWYLTGGSHHSVLVEMADHLVMIEGPQNDARAVAIIEEAKKLVPNKPIRYVVNTHHHFDHAGGLAAFVADGAIVITHDANKDYLQKGLSAPRTVAPDKLAQSGKKPVVEGMADKRVLSDATRTVELHLIKDTVHGDGIIMAYLPKEKLLVEADVYTPGAPNATPPSPPNPNQVSLNNNIERLNLSVDQILPLHGRKVPLAEFHKWIGKAS